MSEAATGEKPSAAPSISWDSHTYVSSAPESLVRDDDLKGANMDMRRRFEANCRRAQVRVNATAPSNSRFGHDSQQANDCW